MKTTSFVVGTILLLVAGLLAPGLFQEPPAPTAIEKPSATTYGEPLTVKHISLEYFDMAKILGFTLPIEEEQGIINPEWNPLYLYVTEDSSKVFFVTPFKTQLISQVRRSRCETHEDYFWYSCTENAVEVRLEAPDESGYKKLLVKIHGVYQHIMTLR